MFARLQTHYSDSPPEGGPGILVDVLRRHLGYSGAYFLGDVSTATRTLITLWRSRADAAASSERTREVLGPRPFALTLDVVLPVVDDRAGAAPDAVPTAAAWVEFGPQLSEARYAALRRADTERIGPAWAATPGTVRAITMWDPDVRMTRIIALAEDEAATEAAARAIRASELHPGEDPALLPGPDRTALHRVEHVDAAAEAGVATTGGAQGG